MCFGIGGGVVPFDLRVSSVDEEKEDVVADDEYEVDLCAEVGLTTSGENQSGEDVRHTGTAKVDMPQCKSSVVPRMPPC